MSLTDASRFICVRSNVEQSLNELVNNIANATPLRTSATWLNWIIVRTTVGYIAFEYFHVQHSLVLTTYILTFK